jgi:uncharacterized protein YyaL (SSP411 family)
VFLTPGLEPFFGGTYFPPRTMGGRPGMIDLLPRVHQAWQEQRAQIEDSGRRVIAALESLSEPDSAAAHHAASFDHAYGYSSAPPIRARRLRHAPKFPSIANLDYLLRYWARDPEHARGARDWC